MKLKRLGNSKKSLPIITPEIIDFIKNNYEEGKSIVYISQKLDASPKLVSNIMKENNIHIRTNREQALKYKCNEAFFESIDNEAKAYWLGFLYADGFILNNTKKEPTGVGISLSEKDKEHLEKFKEALSFEGNIKTYQPSKNNSYSSSNYCRILVISPKIGRDLVEKGCSIQKTFCLNFPSVDIISPSLLSHFVRGYLDGDGSIKLSHNKKKNKMEFGISFLGTLEMLKGLQRVLGVEHLKLQQRFPERNNNNYSLDIGGRLQVYRILHWLYEDATVFLPRKKERYDILKNTF